MEERREMERGCLVDGEKWGVGYIYIVMVDRREMVAFGVA